MKKIGLGIIGCSNRIHGLLNMTPGINEDIEIRGICDPDKNQIKKCKEMFNPDAVVYESAQDLVNATDIDWVAVATWNSLHAPMAAIALQAGKHVFCEKPLATNMKDATELSQVHQQHPQKLMVGFTLRYSDYYKKLKEIITSGKIGNIISFEFNETLNFNHGGHIMSCWRRKEEFTGSHILEKCCHDIDLANWLIDSVPQKVASFGDLDFFKPENEHHMSRLKPREDGVKPFCAFYPDRYENPFVTDKDIIDNQVVILKYENGVKATFHTNLCAGIPERRFYILGTEGALRFNLLSGDIELQRIGFDEKIENIKPSDATDGHGGGDTVLVSYWRKMMMEDAPSVTPLKDGLTSAITCFAIEQARKEEKVVYLNSFWDKI